MKHIILRMKHLKLLWLILLFSSLVVGCSSEKEAEEIKILPEEQNVTKIINEELVTVTDNSFIVTWESDSESRSIIYYGETTEKMKGYVCEDKLVKFHYCEVKDLESGKTYYYYTMSGKVKGEPNEFSPGVVTTLSPPSNEFIFSFASMNDLHFGEEIAGLITVGGRKLNEGMKWPDPQNPHWSFMNRAAIQEINERGADFVIINGDITSEYKEDEFQKAKQYFSIFKMPYIPLRGNHDRVGDNPEDYFVKVFDLKNFSPISGAKYNIDEYGQVYISFVYKGFLFIGLDSSDLKTGWGKLSDQQLDWLEKTLEDNRDKVTIIFIHHPVVSQPDDLLGQLSVLNDTSSRNRLLDIISKNEQVKAVYSGHTHRNKSNYYKGVRFSEMASVKDYPGGYAIHRVYKNGIMTNFYKTRCDECRQWSTMGKNYEFFPNLPAAQYIMFGNFDERNFVVKW